MTGALARIFGVAPEQLGYLLSLFVAIWIGMTLEAFLEERRKRRRMAAWWRGERIG